MRSAYLRAIRYAESLDSSFGRDFVHNAWLYYFDRTGKSLFEQDIPYILFLVKIMWKREISHQYWNHKNGEKEPFQYIDIGTDVVANTVTPEQQLISKETIENIYSKVNSYKPPPKDKRFIPSNTLRELLIYLEHGYSRQQIIEMMGLKNHQTYHDYIKKLRKLITTEFFSSPFNGNKLPIKTKVTRNSYETHRDKYSDFSFDTDRWSDANEFYTQLTHKTENYGLLIVEGKKLDQ